MFADGWMDVEAGRQRSSERSEEAETKAVAILAYRGGLAEGPGGPGWGRVPVGRDRAAGGC